MNIRRATREDCPAMLELIRELAVYEKAPNEVTVDPTHFEESGFGEKPVWWGFVVEEEVEEVEAVEEVEGIEKIETVIKAQKVKVNEMVEEVNEEILSASTSSTSSTASTASTPSTLSTPIIAFALYYIRYSTWKGQVMYLEDILVTEEMRGKGIGSMLMDRLLEEAKEKGFKRISWQVLDWNEPAINFYKKYGASFDGEWVNVNLLV